MFAVFRPLRPNLPLWWGMLILLSGALLSASETDNTNLKTGLNTITITAGAPGQKGFKKIPLDVYIPRGGTFQGDLLVLPGWNFSRTRWHRETPIRRYCDKHKIRAVFPDMGKSNYESRYFPETYRRWSPVPGGTWIQETMLPVLQKRYGLFLKGKKNFLLGLSTGGRGVLLVSLQNEGLFTAGATLSGDCDQTRYPGDRLMIGQYGPYSKFKERWRTVDNPLTAIAEKQWNMPLYIGHGREDRVSPYKQSVWLYKSLKKHNPDLRVKFHAVTYGGHNFAYWASEIDPVFKFFTSFTKK